MLGSSKPLVLRMPVLWLSGLLALFGSPLQASLQDALGNKALFELQPYKEETSALYEGKSITSATLVNLNAHINAWYLLGVKDGRKAEVLYNIQPASDSLTLGLDPASPELVISNANGESSRCDIETEIVKAHAKRPPRLGYLAVCNNALFLIIKQEGNQATVEKGAEMLRWLAGEAGEDIINGVKETVFQDKYLVNETTEEAQESPEAGANPDPDPFLPRAAIHPRFKNTTIPTNQLGMKTAKSERSLLAGRWYPLLNYPDIYASMIEPGMVSKEILASHHDRVNGLDGVENGGVAYLMAINLSRYSLGWGHGTDLPGVGWSSRAINIKRDNPYGPDGFNTFKPLIPLGHTLPSLWPKVVGTLSGGFQNRHSAFRYGELSKSQKAHHYGFMENGVLFVTPSTGLATLITYKDGSVELKTWTEQDTEKMPLMKHIRQNGVPLIDRDEQGQGIPGKLVKHWSAGNWSGSADKELRTPRGAACIIETPQDKFLVYAYFSGATPSGLARVFQAYGCNYAIHLDMNSPGQAYASLSRPKGGNSNAFEIEHLMTGMFTGDTSGTPRYLVKPDYKDFFYILKRD